MIEANERKDIAVNHLENHEDNLPEFFKSEQLL